MKRVLALTRYGPRAASTRQRFLQFAPALAEAGFALECSPLFSDRHTADVRHDRGVAIGALASAYARRLAAIITARRADALWVQYEMLPFVPGPLEGLARLIGRPVVIDFDDAFFLRYDQTGKGALRALLGGKMKRIVGLADHIVAGNPYLADHLGRWSNKVSVVPTVVDTNQYVPSVKRNDPPTIGWIGSPTTFTVYVRPHLEMLQRVCERHGARFLVVGAGEDAQASRFAAMEVRDWSEEREIADIQDMDIGIMPLPDDAWARGKCGYKLIQYMACGLPTVASPVGVNTALADGGRCGLLAVDADEWESALSMLLADPDRCRAMGEHGRALVERNYSLQSQAPRIVDIFRALLPG